MIHYVERQLLWEAVSAALGLLFPTFVDSYRQLASGPPCLRWGFSVGGRVQVSKQQVQMLAVAAAAYQQVSHDPHLSIAATARSAATQLCA